MPLLYASRTSYRTRDAKRFSEFYIKQMTGINCVEIKNITIDQKNKTNTIAIKDK